MSEELNDENEKAKLGKGRGGDYGAPGSQYHVVIATIWELPTGDYRVDLRERWGSNQGYLQDTEDREVSGWGSSLVGAMERARNEAVEMDMSRGLVAEAVTQARREVDGD